MTAPTPQKKNRRVGLIAAGVLLLMIALAFYLQQRQGREEVSILAQADAEMSRALSGDCQAFDRARRLYCQVMRNRLQSKDLAAKVSLCAELSKMCRQSQEEIIASRKAVIAAGPLQLADVRALALAQLASGDKAGALATLDRMPQDKFCRWFGGWLRDLPVTAVKNSQ